MIEKWDEGIYPFLEWFTSMTIIIVLCFDLEKPVFPPTLLILSLPMDNKTIEGAVSS